jgi:hypothetical protein
MVVVQEHNISFFKKDKIWQFKIYILLKCSQ